MTRQEYIRELSSKLYNELPTMEALKNIRYYQEYFEGALKSGKTESEIIEELGTPDEEVREILGLEPIEDESERVVPSEAVDKVDTEETAEQPEENDISEVIDESADAEEPAVTERSAADLFETVSAEESAAAEEPAAESQARAEATKPAGKKRRDWSLLIALFAVLAAVFAGIWLIARITAVIGPFIVCILAMLLILYTIGIKKI